MSIIKLEAELREMRERVIEMNTSLNKKLDRYEILSSQQKQEIAANPHKFLKKSIELNKKIIEKQLANIRKVYIEQYSCKTETSSFKRRTIW